MRLLRTFLLLAALVLLLRSTLLAPLAGVGVWLDVTAVATAFWALRQGESWGASFGFVLGLAADLDAGSHLGRHALALALIGFAAGRLSSTLVRESARTQFLLAALATLAHQAYALSFDLGLSWVTMGYWTGRVVLSALLTAAGGVALLEFMRLVRRRPVFQDVPSEPGKA
jgi:rod shape-determining protein MreD